MTIRDAITIKIPLNKGSETLEAILSRLPAFHKTTPYSWDWRSNLGNIQVIVLKNRVYNVNIRAENNTHITEERVNRLASMIKRSYGDKEVKIVYNSDFK